ncbi:MAG: GatB/YqeY domain-containing protein [Elusimicrobia bacterium]|nr:GatB/YqeY domain-containing protein [Elusimicrobiota bacterium]MBD3411967.1 GatB/YqeY domain-containing protein [Elusimicrobiota bacterium]
MDTLTRDSIQKELNRSLKDNNQVKVSVLRLLISAIRNKEIELKRTLSAADIIGVVAAQVKLRRESVEGYRQGGRHDLVEKEEKELAILQQYMPPAMSEEELKQQIETIISKTGASSIKDIGTVMGQLMPLIKGRADGKLANQLVRQRLSSE